MVDDGAVGAAQGHLHGLCACGRAAGALVLHVLCVDGVQGFAGASSLRRGRERRPLRAVESPRVGRALGQPASSTCPPPIKKVWPCPEKHRTAKQCVKIALGRSERPVLMELSHPSPLAAISMPV